MSVTTKLMTWQEFAALPADGQRHELIRGEVVTMPLPGFDHGVQANNINIPLGYFVKQNRLGTLPAAETGYLLETDPDVVRGADVSFVSATRHPVGVSIEGYFRGPPDLAVEVISPSDRLYDVEEKVEEWLAAGARLVWVVNPRRKVVVVHRPGVEPVTFREDQTLDAGDVVPGFALPVADIFA